MKTFYQFLNEAPLTPPGAPPTPPPGGPASPPTGGASLGGPPSPGGGGGLGGPPMGGGGLGGPPMGGGSPSLGSPPMGGDPSKPQGQINVQKSKPLSVWQALEKIIQSKNGQSQNKMLNSDQP